MVDSKWLYFYDNQNPMVVLDYIIQHGAVDPYTECLSPIQKSGIGLVFGINGSHHWWYGPYANGWEPGKMYQATNGQLGHHTAVWQGWKMCVGRCSRVPLGCLCTASFPQHQGLHQHHQFLRERSTMAPRNALFDSGIVETRCDLLQCSHEFW